MAGLDEKLGASNEAPPPADPNDPWIGQKLGSYTIIRRLGEGGMGIVYLGRHESLHRLAAIKFLPGEMASDGAYIELFLREARSAARLSHPNVVAVHDAGNLGDAYYFIMEYVEGTNLGDMLKKRGVLPLNEAIDYTRQAAQALGYAHKKGIVHRDVKPENLMLTEEKVIKVGDLGLAKWVGDEDGTFTQSEWVLGSPVYISPERLRDPHFIDPRVDIYSLGATFYHLITGRIPYQGSSPVIMSQHLTAPVPDPRESNPVVDQEITPIIRRMMAKELTDRYQSMEEVDAALAEFQIRKLREPGAPAAATPPSAPVLPADESRPSVASAEKPKSSAGPKIAIGIAAMLLLACAGYYFMNRKAAVSLPPLSPSETGPAGAAGPALALSNFNSSDIGRLGSWSADPSNLSQSIDPSAGSEGSGAWRMDFDITQKGSGGRAWVKLPEIDATPYKYLSFRIRYTGGNPTNVPVEFTIGPASRRHLVNGVGSDWLNVRIPLREMALPSLQPLLEFTVYFERETSGPRKGSVFIDDLQLVRD